MIYSFVIISVIIARRIVISKLGRAFMAIRDSEQAAQASGINLAKYKMLSFLFPDYLPASQACYLLTRAIHFY
jgi:branched-chain amino acid transport system permease protein